MLSRTFKYKKTVFLIMLVMAVSQSYAQYEIRKYSINSGSSTISEGQYEMTSSIAQVDASNELSSGDYTIRAGVWQQNTDLIKRNGFE
ncbi:MAG: hypothetical protein AB8B80_16255 [Marinicellaceae bacterium]